MPRLDNCTLRSIYLISISLIFLCAHLSFYVQFPGLLSSYGIEPASTRILPHSFPNLQKILLRNDVDCDSFIEIMCLSGILLSSIASSGIIQHGSIFVFLTAIYFFLTKVGGSMYSFQWDILLTEVGAVTAICCAPWLSVNISSGSRKYDNDQQSSLAASSIGPWAVRFLLFKLMFMSGVVKIQANCPTWLNLTALEYHFATQCLPGPLAWHAHQLHPFFLRLSVAATFVIEIPATFLLICPLHTCRIVGAWAQIILQLVIILTGNYNFFNWLTIALCLPCFESCNTTADNTRFAGGLWWKRLECIGCFAYLLWAASDMCNFESVDGRWNVTLAWTKTHTDSYITNTIPLAVPATFAFVLTSSLKYLTTILGDHQKRNRRIRIMSGVVQLGVSCLCIGILSIPMLDLTPQLSESGYYGSHLFSPLWLTARSYHLSSGYGLFRRMTGVSRSTPGMGMGWAGLPEPSVVARPEIIVEVQFKNGNVTESSPWNEIKFRWKPGDLNQRPLQVSPHQPRLDWRMWFAALGTYNHNPWFVALINRLLQGCPDAISLLDEPEIAAGEKRITRVRSSLYSYDFTRVPSEWSKGIPGVALLRDGIAQDLEEKEIDTLSSSRLEWWRAMLRLPQQYWQRSYVREYTPPLEKNNQSVQKFLSSNGYGATCLGQYSERCKLLLNPSLCKLTMSIRENNLFWLPVIALTAVLTAHLFSFCLVSKEQSKLTRSVRNKRKNE